MNTKKIAVFAGLLLICGSAFCQRIIQTEGNGKTEEIAKSNALASMSQTFRTHVQSSTNATQSYVQTKGKETKTTSIAAMEKRILVSSEMPLYGVTFNVSNNGLKGKDIEYTAVATMNSKTALPLYKKEITSLKDKINSRNKNISKLNGEKEDNEWQLLSADYAAFDKMEMILLVLEEENTIKPELSSTDFRIKYE